MAELFKEVFGSGEPKNHYNALVLNGHGSGLSIASYIGDENNSLLYEVSMALSEGRISLDFLDIASCMMGTVDTITYLVEDSRIKYILAHSHASYDWTSFDKLYELRNVKRSQSRVIYKTDRVETDTDNPLFSSTYFLRLSPDKLVRDPHFLKEVVEPSGKNALLIDGLKFRTEVSPMVTKLHRDKRWHQALGTIKKLPFGKSKKWIGWPCKDNQLNSTASVYPFGGYCDNWGNFDFLTLYTAITRDAPKEEWSNLKVKDKLNSTLLYYSCWKSDGTSEQWEKDLKKTEKAFLKAKTGTRQSEKESNPYV